MRKSTDQLLHQQHCLLWYIYCTCSTCVSNEFTIMFGIKVKAKVDHHPRAHSRCELRRTCWVRPSLDPRRTACSGPSRTCASVSQHTRIDISALHCTISYTRTSIHEDQMRGCLLFRHGGKGAAIQQPTHVLEPTRDAVHAYRNTRTT